MFKWWDLRTGRESDCNDDPLIGEIGRLDEPVILKSGRLTRHPVGDKPWIELALIGFVLMAGLLSGVWAFTILFLVK